MKRVEATLFPVPPKPKVTKPPTPTNVLVALWVRLFVAKFGEQPAVTPRDGLALKRIVALCPDVAVVGRRLEAYLRLEDPYLAGEGYPLVLLPGAWNKLITREREEAGGRVVPDAVATEKYLRSLPGGRR